MQGARQAGHSCEYDRGLEGSLISQPSWSWTLAHSPLACSLSFPASRASRLLLMVESMCRYSDVERRPEEQEENILKDAAARKLAQDCPKNSQSCLVSSCLVSSSSRSSH